MFAAINLNLVVIHYVHSKDRQIHVMPVGKEVINGNSDC